MSTRNASDETRTPFLLEALQGLGTEARESGPQDEGLPAAEHECECGGRCHEASPTDEVFESEDAFATEEEDYAGSPDAFERYQAESGDVATEAEDVASEWEDVGSEWESPTPADEDEAEEPRDFAESFEADAILETEEEAPDLAYDLEENEDETPYLETMEAAQVEAEAPMEEAEVVVSTGEFGNALARFAKIFGVPDAVPWLLKQSPAFQEIVKVLDKKYLSFDRPAGIPDEWADKFGQDDAGVFTKGPHVGRRMLAVRPSNHGSYFRPVFSPGGFLAMDVIGLESPSFQLPGLDQRGAWLERILHESIHAHRHVLGLRRSGSTPALRTTAAIDDEIATRTEEGRIVADLRRRFPSFGRYQPRTGSLVRHDVERDFFPGDLRLTYLEFFVLNERLEEARRTLEAGFRVNKRSATADQEIAAYDAFVDRIPLEKRPLGSYIEPDPTFTRPDRDRSARFLLDYPRVRLIRRIIDARWRDVQALDLDVADPKLRKTRRDHVEKMRQEHAAAFFAGIASYTKLP